MSKILILDFGSQYTNVLAKKIRSLSVYCEVVPWNISVEDIQKHNSAGLIFSGGPNSVYESGSPYVDQAIYECGLPILGVCYGMQLMARDFGGEVKPGDSEFGYTPVSLYPCTLFDGIVEEECLETEVRMSHCDSVISLPQGFSSIASSQRCPVAAMECVDKKLYGLQFHPEVSDTTCVGLDIVRNFVLHICQAPQTWNVDSIEKQLINHIRSQVPESEKVILGLSGGVDSTVAAVLLHKALGSRLVCVLVDSGLLRNNEVQEVQQCCSALGLSIHIEDAQEIFFQHLVGVSDPEEKRKVIGATFIEVFERLAATLNVQWLAQGTIYSDVIESAGSGNATQVIKSHHNVGGLPEHLNVKLLEPFRFLFKDEVRSLGYKLGLPSCFIQRHPFPGPGLGVRVLGEVRSAFVHILRRADAIFLEELRKHGWYDKVSQAFAVFLPVRSVSVKGDARCYGYTIALRAIQSVDFMTGSWVDLPHEFLNHCSTRIINEIAEVSRVVYDISDKPPATIEWE